VELYNKKSIENIRTMIKIITETQLLLSDVLVEELPPEEFLQRFTNYIAAF